MNFIAQFQSAVVVGVGDSQEDSRDYSRENASPAKCHCSECCRYADLAAKVGMACEARWGLKLLPVDVLP
ncbi:MAG TPA: hypothetical protein VIY29_04850, partial [Ktedonobacteraceae bacterium]